MKLTDEQLRSPLWLELRKEYERKLSVVRKTNDSHKPEVDTAALRGKIIEIKEFLRLDPTWSE